MLLDCQWCDQGAAQLVEGSLIIKARHHGDWHYTRVPVTELLHLAATEDETIIRCDHCNCAIGRVGGGEVAWWCKHSGSSHTQTWPVLRLSTLNTCEKLVELRRQIGDDLPYLQASSQALTSRDATRRLGKILQIIADTLQP